MRLVSIRLDGLELHYVTAEAFQYRGRSALRVVDAAPGHGNDVSRICGRQEHFDAGRGH